MNKIDFFSRLSRFAKPARLNRLPRFVRICLFFFKKIYPIKNIFEYSKKEYLFLPFSSCVTFGKAQWEACELKKHNQIASFAIFLSLECWKFQSTVRISKSAADARVLLISCTGHPRTSEAEKC